ncbi:hypothetical protein S103564_2110 [Staphylococcus aureus subsp. aureus 103564]|nr:hypothetical protein S103564_2110 [Staphylococcus aureus subsp. aureus 103564]
MDTTKHIRNTKGTMKLNVHHSLCLVVF